MRQDIAKVICEDGRRGSRDNTGIDQRHDKFYRYRDKDSEDRNGEYAHLDALPRHEGMRHRVKIGYGELRGFSENLAPIRGLVVKNVGKN